VDTVGTGNGPAISEEYMNFPPNEASEYLHLNYGIRRTARTLANLRSCGGGPRYYRVSRTEVLYSRRDLDHWAQSKLGGAVAHTAEEYNQ
jgi:hypothetical protein